MHLSRVLWSLAAAATLSSGCAGDGAEPSASNLGHSGQEIVNGQINNGDPALAFIWLGGGSCSGTLVSPKVIVTARHCFINQQGVQADKAQMAVLFNTQPKNGDPAIGVADYKTHPDADLAVLTLTAPHTATPIPMTTRAPVQGEAVRIAGYGVTAQNNTDSGTKRVGYTSVAGTENVQGFGSVFYVGQSGSKTCYGDSGGPAFITYDGVEYLAGVTSFGTGPCENAATLDGELRVDIYNDWIKSYIQEKDPTGVPGTEPAPDTEPTPGAGPDTTLPEEPVGVTPSPRPEEVPGPATAGDTTQPGAGTLDSPAILGGCNVTASPSRAGGGGLGFLLLLGTAFLARTRPRRRS